MIRTALLDPEGQHLELGHLELADEWEASDRKIIWIDIGGESSDVEESILGRFGAHPLAIQDAMRQRHPPKLEVFEDQLFILLRGVDAESTNIEFGVIQLAVFIGDRFLITRHNKASTSANALYESLTADPSLLAEGVTAFAIRLWNRLARRYIEILLELEPRLDAIEEEMFERPSDALLAELTGYKSKLRQLSRIARYHLHVIGGLSKAGSEFVPETLEHEIIDLYEQTERTQSLADLYYEVACDLTDGYLAVSSHRLNGVMRFLTIITVLFVPLTFIAGIYGMNFENIPETRSASGYFIVIGVMVLIAITQLIVFRRKGWL